MFLKPPRRERSSRLITIKTVTSSRKEDVLEKNDFEALRFLKAGHLEFDQETGRSSVLGDHQPCPKKIADLFVIHSFFLFVM